METIVAVYDNALHAEQAIGALRRANVPTASIHRQTREVDDVTSERPPIVHSEGAGLWPALFGTSEPEEHLIYDDSAEAGGTVVRVSMIPENHYEAVLEILGRYHPVDLKGRHP
jgi:hypothetical protein